MMEAIFFVISIFLLSSLDVQCMQVDNLSFDWSLVKSTLRDTPSRNMMLSPYTVKVILSVLREASGGATRRELNVVLPKIKLNNVKLKYLDETLESLRESNDNYTLEFGNQLFVDRSIKVDKFFEKFTSLLYGISIRNVNFGKPRLAVDIINKWCANITKNHITELVTIDEVRESIAHFVSAIFMQASWEVPFSEINTFSSSFYFKPRKFISVPYMVTTGKFYMSKSFELNSTLLRLPYSGGKLSMTIILPEYGIELSDVVKKLNSKTVRHALSLMEPTEAIVEIPRFSFTRTVHLKQYLQKLNIKEIFRNSASFFFFKTDDEDFKISNIIHKAGIEVNERGTTGFVATDALLIPRSASAFSANRPFLFTIDDESTGAVLIAGQVLNPLVD